MTVPSTDAYALPSDRECLLAVLTSLLIDSEIPPMTSTCLERFLGIGWVREYASARDQKEREELIVRRLRLHRPVRIAQMRRNDDAISYEDGGAW